MLIPVQKKFSKPQSTRFSHTSNGNSVMKPRISLRILWIVFGSIVACYGVFLWIKYTLFVPAYTINKIDYALANVTVYDDPYLYKLFTTLLKWENYRVVQLEHSSILSQIQAAYPFVTDFTVTYKSPNRVFVKASFQEPKLIVFNGNLRYAVYNQKFFQLFSGNTLWSGALRVELFPAPSMPTAPVIPVNSTTVHSWSFVTGVHLTGVISTWVSLLPPVHKTITTGTSLTGLFYQESFEHFVDTLQTIYTAFPGAKYYIYLVGWQRIIVGLSNGREVYVNLLVDLVQQLQNYQYLRQYYSDFAKLKRIDLWSIEMDKVIVRK